jgi:hypothetical protein
MAVHAYTLAKLAALRGDAAEAARDARRALAALRVAHAGPEPHPLVAAITAHGEPADGAAEARAGGSAGGAPALRFSSVAVLPAPSPPSASALAGV